MRNELNGYTLFKQQYYFQQAFILQGRICLSSINRLFSFIIFLMQIGSQVHNSIEITHQKINRMIKECEVKEETLQKLPEIFLQFLNQRGLNKQQLVIPIPRYVRVKPGIKLENNQLAEQLGLTEKEVVKVDDYFWAINPKAKINHCKLYEEGLLYGMDYSSAIPVKCLQIHPKNSILQLCCAPGNKSMLMADSYQDLQIKGVEISQNRANIMKNLIKKYKHQKTIEVIVQDGLKFDSAKLFDRVLVDAQCTHEGSLKHIYKFFKDEEKQYNKVLKVQKKLSKQQEKQFKKNNTNPYTSEIKKNNQWSKEDFEQRFLDPYKLSQLNKLQFGLLENGFRLLKNEGIIVYSTCSFDYQQNQKIVQDFIEKYPNAHLMDAGKTLNAGVGWKYGKLQGTIRLSPSVSACGGMFVAKLIKKQE